MKEQMKPLHLAAAEGHFAKVESLLAAHADLEARDPEGWTPMLRAINNGRQRIVELLLKAGANPNTGRLLLRAERFCRSKSDKLETPLSLAAWLGDLRTLDLLLNAGARLEGSGCESVAC